MTKKAKIITTLFAVIVLAACVLVIVHSVSQKSADLAVAEEIVSLTDESGVAIGDVSVKWDYVIIDSSYNIENSVKANSVKGSGSFSDIPMEDGVIAVVFVKNDRVSAYTYVESKYERTFSVLENYLFERTDTVYDYDTVLT